MDRKQLRLGLRRQEGLKCCLIVILELGRIKAPGLRIQDVGRESDHVLRQGKRAQAAEI